MIDLPNYIIKLDNVKFCFVYGDHLCIDENKETLPVCLTIHLFEWLGCYNEYTYHILSVIGTFTWAVQILILQNIFLLIL